jgi:hypothetical protein
MQGEAYKDLPGGVAREQVLVEGKLEVKRRAADRTGDEHECDELQVEGSWRERDDGKT